MNTTTVLGDKPVNRIGYGAMQLAGPGVFGPPRDPAAARAVLRRAIELGVEHRRDDTGGVLPAQRPDELREGVEANLRSLQVERLDLVNLRLVGAGDPGIALEDQLGELEDLRHEGKLDLIGLSNVDQIAVERALELVAVAEIQNAYSIIDRHDDELVDFADAHQIAFVPFGPLGSAYRRGPARLGAEATIGRVASKHGATPAQIALAWLLARSDRMLLIPGTSSLAHLEENMASAAIALDDADLAALDRVGVSSRRDQS